ncbi:tRNA (guanosine(37)-N1)-methyltransferase TrmD [Aurantivibrio plasticivorans]
MKIAVISLFPEMFTAISESGISRRAIENGLLEIRVWNPRDFTSDKHQTVDDRPYGGGPGMVMKVDPLRKAIAAASEWAGESKVVYLSPQGETLNQQYVESLASGGQLGKNLVLIAGRYEGVDQRLIDQLVDEEISIGDYVLSGGELPAMVLIDALIRQLPGALGDAESAQQDSFSNGLLDWPHFTRPEVLDGQIVPAVLLSGNHEAIRRWRLKQALGKTWQVRPELLAGREFSDEERALLNEFQMEQSQHT